MISFLPYFYEGKIWIITRIILEDWIPEFRLLKKLEVNLKSRCSIDLYLLKASFFLYSNVTNKAVYLSLCLQISFLENFT